jgi:heptosyltransferase III
VPSQKHDILILQCRNFGDAVISTGLVEALGRSLPNANISVFTRPQFHSLFADSPYISQIYTAAFPMGTTKRFGFKAILELGRQIRRLRALRFARVVHVGGDLRENLIGWLIAPRGLLSPTWRKGNAFRRNIRDGLGFLRSGTVEIDAGNPNIYAAQQQVAAALGATAEAHPRLYAAGQALRHEGKGNAIGLHVSASQPSKMWPVASWRALIAGLRRRGMAVTIFGAPDERTALLEDYADLVGPGVEISTGNLTEFFAAVSGMSALVCLDSFSAHAAHAIGVPILMLTGSTVIEAYRPPASEVIDGGIGMACSPCMNKPTCMKTAHPYQCMRGIEPGAVLKRLDLMGALSSKTPGEDETPRSGAAR